MGIERIRNEELRYERHCTLSVETLFERLGPEWDEFEKKNMPIVAVWTKSSNC